MGCYNTLDYLYNGASINNNKNLGSLGIVLWTCLFFSQFFQFNAVGDREWVIRAERVTTRTVSYTILNMFDMRAQMRIGVGGIALRNVLSLITYQSETRNFFFCALLLLCRTTDIVFRRFYRVVRFLWRQKYSHTAAVFYSCIFYHILFRTTDWRRFDLTSGRRIVLLRGRNFRYAHRVHFQV